jgi:hypothetical protein
MEADMERRFAVRARLHVILPLPERLISAGVDRVRQLARDASPVVSRHGDDWDVAVEIWASSKDDAVSAWWRTVDRAIMTTARGRHSAYVALPFALASSVRAAHVSAGA